MVREEKFEAEKRIDVGWGPYLRGTEVGKRKDIKEDICKELHEGSYTRAATEKDLQAKTQINMKVHRTG